MKPASGQNDRSDPNENENQKIKAANGLKANSPGVPATGEAAQPMRQLKWDKVVMTGDYVKDGRQGFEPWEGPAGFQAGSFVKAIFRQGAGVAAEAAGED